MVDAIPVDLKVTLKYDSGSFTYGDLKMNAENEDIFELASAFSSLQDRDLRKIIKSEVFALASY